MVVLSDGGLKEHNASNLKPHLMMMMMIGDWLMEVVVARISNCIYEFTVQC